MSLDKGGKNMGRMKISVAAVFMCTFIISAVPASAGTSGRSVETTLQSDLAGSLNPEGLLLTVGGYRRWISGMNEEYGIPSSYVQSGAMLGVSPAYSHVSAHVEWKPVILAQVRLQYTLFRYFGDFGALLSFPSKDSPFGKDEVDAREGQEEKDWGQRYLLQPTLTAKAGPIIIRNQSDAAYFTYNGAGPYFLEWEYDTLVKDGGWVVSNRTFLLWEAWKGPGKAALLAGTVYEITRSFSADLTRRRIGAVAVWTPAEGDGLFQKPRIYSQVGVNLEDRNRDGEVYFIIGAGFDHDL
ncbi:MAG TPA: hypothetical protein DCS42_02160 [Nitrospiraceae bacterium]|nr:MAG: hypothetical protein A2X57_00875 [Nitrospirae bacterium GWD2_57_8]HAR45535.1 hypothetical protein [Nitrospiraceae bacterium]HAS52997.1 hypothetical protein [Nitrospiraceae bacterium]